MLAGVGETVPNPHLLIGPFMRREAVLSSRIEGTQASLSDVFMYEASSIPRRDVKEVINYIVALELGISELDKLPISLRLLNKMHAKLLEGVRGEEKCPGVLRGEQVWIGLQPKASLESKSRRDLSLRPRAWSRDLILDFGEVCQ